MDKVKITSERTHCFAPAINIVMSVDISGNVSAETFKKAILQAVDHHILLTSGIVQDESGDFFYIPTGKQTAEIRVLQNSGSLQEIINTEERVPFDLEDGKLLRFFILPQRNAARLILVAHHLAGDGLAMLYLLRDIMNCLSGTAQKKAALPITLFDSSSIPKDANLSFF